MVRSYYKQSRSRLQEPSAGAFTFNHAPAPKGEVYAAAKAGKVTRLEAALRAGGSTEETDEVRCN